MSRFTLVFTFVVSAGFITYAFSEGAGTGRADSRPADACRPSRIYGFPDSRGIVLSLRQEEFASCEASRFRDQSPRIVLWDDGTVVYRDATYDYRKGRMQPATQAAFLRAFAREARRKDFPGCTEYKYSPGRHDRTILEGRPDGRPAELVTCDVEFQAGVHAASCRSCREFRPLARLIGDLKSYRAPEGPLLTGLPMEVSLQFRSCGCRNHPEIVSVSSAWPLPGPRPSERCGKSSGIVRLRLTDPVEIQTLARALERSAAVLDGEEIYTCFMRPVLEIGTPAPLSQR